MKNKASSWGLFWLLSVLIIVALMALSHVTKAQDNATWFTVTCLESLGDEHYRVHFGYTSQGGETFTTAFDDKGHAVFVTVPDTFVAIDRDEWYLDAHSIDSSTAFEVLFTGAEGVHTLALSAYSAPCAEGTYPPDADATPEPPSTLPWAHDSATGREYQYMPQTGGLVPLPAAGV